MNDRQRNLNDASARFAILSLAVLAGYIWMARRNERETEEQLIRERRLRLQCERKWTEKKQQLDGALERIHTLQQTAAPAAPPEPEEPEEPEEREEPGQ